MPAKDGRSEGWEAVLGNLARVRMAVRGAVPGTRMRDAFGVRRAFRRGSQTPHGAMPSFPLEGLICTCVIKWVKYSLGGNVTMRNDSAAMRRHEVLRLVWRAGEASLSDLHRTTGMRPNTLGEDLDALVRAGLLRPKAVQVRGRGRPRVPFEIDPERRNVLGLALKRGQVEVGRLNLLGKYLGDPTSLPAEGSVRMLTAARSLLKGQLDRTTLSVGIATPGFVDLERRAILRHPGCETSDPIDLEPLCRLAGRRPVILENDLQALAARWLLTRKTGPREDMLLVHFDDGEMGAALLIDGRPNRGCVSGANELGHARFPVPTARCFCGHTGCLERICSTDFLMRNGADVRTLQQRAAAFVGTNDPGLDEVIRYLALGFANAVNFSRVRRLVLVSSLLRHAAFLETLLKGIRRQLMEVLASRVEIEVWDRPVLRLAETAGWLALAAWLLPGWDRNR